MSTKAAYIRHDAVTAIIAGLASLVVALTLLAGVADLFLQKGFPLERVVTAERACRGHTFESERKACVQAFLAESYHRRVAIR